MSESRVTLEEPFLEPYARFSLYNSPYAAHDRGCAIDLYPGTLRDGRTTVAPSPVAGTVLETKTVRAPPKPYAPDHDHLLLIACDEAALERSGIRIETEDADSAGTPGTSLVCRVLHVEPTVEPGDHVEIGDSLGRLVRAGFFAPWVDNHLHVGFRRPDQHLERAGGSLPLTVGSTVELAALEWDGTGTVVERGETYAVLDAPVNPDPGNEFVGIAADCGSVLDGGIPHYDNGGLLGRASDSGAGVVSLWGTSLGTPDGRTVEWDDLTVTVDGVPITGLSCFCARDAHFGAKLICPDLECAVGDDVRVRIDRVEREDS